MFNETHLTAVRVSAAYLMFQDSQLSSYNALSKLEKDFLNFKDITPNDSTEYQHLKLLVEANVDSKSFGQIMRLSHNFYAKIYTNLWDRLRALKISQAESYEILIQHNFSYLTGVIDRAILLLSRVSNFMSGPQKLSLQKAIDQALNPSHPQHVTHITREDVNLLLREEAKIQLYMHARVGLVIGVDNYDNERQPDKLLRENAKLLVEHDEIYFKVDRGLTELGFTLAQCNEFLSNSTNETIEGLYEKVLLLKDPQIQALKNPAVEDKILNSQKEFDKQQSALNQPNQDQAFVPTPKTSALMSPGQFTLLNSQITPSNSRNLISGINNSTLLFGIEAAAFMVAMACYYRPPIVVSTISLVKRAGCKVLGFCRTKESQAAVEQEERITVKYGLSKNG
ncbi:MAG: hypothetical protein V4501_01750 [Pseudomonadota bacterium]